MQTSRYKRVAQLTQDVIVSNNRATVLGLLGVPFNAPNGSAGTIPMFDQNGLQINLLSVLPINAIPNIPFENINNPNTEPQFNYRFQGGV